MPDGTVLELYRYPVKSMAGERVDAVELDERGASDDRRHAVWLRGGRRLTARVAPKLLAWHAARNGGGSPRVTGPDGRTYAWDAELERAIGAAVGRDVALVEDPDGLQDVQGTLLVTVEGSRRRLEDELGAPVDIRRFRPNVHVDLPDADPFTESGWEGRTFTVGGARLEILHPCDRCAITIHDPDRAGDRWPDLLRTINDHHDTFFGFRARALGRARVAVGDPVAIEAP